MHDPWMKNPGEGEREREREIKTVIVMHNPRMKMRCENDA